MADEKILGGERIDETKTDASEMKNGTDETKGFLVESSKEVKIEGSVEQREGKYNEILSQVTPQSTPTLQSTDDHLLDAKSIGDTIDEESKIQKLLDLATERGVVYAVKVARSLGDYYALDRMHDDIADKLYEGLLAKGLIKKE